jgi:hypothetical protein
MMCVCLCVYPYVCTYKLVHIYIYTHTQHMLIFIHTRTFQDLNTSILPRTWEHCYFLNLLPKVCVCVCMCIYIYVCIYIYMCVCVCCPWDQSCGVYACACTHANKPCAACFCICACMHVCIRFGIATKAVMCMYACKYLIWLPEVWICACVRACLLHELWSGCYMYACGVYVQVYVHLSSFLHAMCKCLYILLYYYGNMII